MNKIFDKRFRDLVESNKEGTTIQYKGSEYFIITGMIVQDLSTGKYYMKGIDF